VLHLDPRARVLIALADPAVFGKDTQIIVDYYRGLERFADRVVVVRALPSQLRDAVQGLSASDATPLLADLADERSDGQLLHELADATCGPADQGDYRACVDMLAQRGFTATGNYVLVNFRDSGHNSGPERPNSHPEHDTGAAGFWDLMEAVVLAGYQPVPMGGLPGGRAWPGPSLHDYFTWPVCAANARRNKRQAEYFLLRALKVWNRGVKALAWRSGVTDAISFAGIPVIALDVDRSQGHGRAKSREQILPDGHYTQTDLSDRATGEPTDRKFTDGVAGWIGALLESDTAVVAAALGGRKDKVGSR
jgi:hypothetical protein